MKFKIRHSYLWWSDPAEFEKILREYTTKEDNDLYIEVKYLCELQLLLETLRDSLELTRLPFTLLDYNNKTIKFI